MEALIILFGEMIFAILAPFILLVVDFFGWLIGLIGSLVWRNRPQGETTRRAMRALSRTLLAIGGVIIAALIIVNSFFFDSAVRKVFDTVDARNGIATTCDDIDGSVFTGRITLNGCRVIRADHESSTFDLTIATADINLRIMSLLGTATLDDARVAGLKGWIMRPRPAGPDEQGEQEVRPRRDFIIERLDVSDVEVTLSGINADGNPFELPVQVRQLSGEPLRSNMALFDILFRANASGTIAGAAFEISSRPAGDGRITRWRASQVPVAELGSVSGGILSWFSEGYVDVAVDDEWALGDGVSIDMDWRLEFEQLEVAAPDGTGPVARLASAPLVRYVNSFDGAFPLEFQMVLNENQFIYKSSLAAAGLWNAVGEAVNNTLRSLGVKIEGAKETGQAIKEGAISVLDRIRQRDEDEEADDK